jgi:gamma-glutamyltranspeptidase/glutathione hydrolase
MPPLRRVLLPTLLMATMSSFLLEAHEPVYARHGMVVTEEPAATGVGVAVLKTGGNAIDAAVAVGFALAVTHPYAGNLGGGGFMLVRLADGRSTFIDFRETAPGKAARDMYLDAKGNPTSDSVDGWRSTAVPGSVRGFELAQSKYGRKKWPEVLAPAIELAAKGFMLSFKSAESLKAATNLAADPESRRIFQNGGVFYNAGDRLVQPQLAAVLQRLAKAGGRDFYEGETARVLAAEMAKHGGLITLDDLKHYQAVERTPLTGSYRGYGILTAPLPSSGGIGLLQMLGMLEGSGYEKGGAGSAAAIHYTAEVMRRFFADRAQFMGDPDFVKVPVKGLLDPAYLRARQASIALDRATPSGQLLPGEPAGREGTETTHYSIVDSEGNAVSVTYTLNNGYGSGVTVPGLGFLLNDEMDDFTSKPNSPNLFGLIQGAANAIAPGKRPVSAMTPTIVLRDGTPFMVLGAPGGPRITTAVLQVLLNVIDFGMNIQDAVDAPRFHHQWKPDRLYLEGGISPDTVRLLEARGHAIEYSPGVVLARVEAILIDRGWLQGAADSRWVGKAEGY